MQTQWWRQASVPPLAALLSRPAALHVARDEGPALRPVLLDRLDEQAVLLRGPRPLGIGHLLRIGLLVLAGGLSQGRGVGRERRGHAHRGGGVGDCARDGPAGRRRGNGHRVGGRGCIVWHGHRGDGMWHLFGDCVGDLRDRRHGLHLGDLRHRLRDLELAVHVYPM